MVVLSICINLFKMQNLLSHAFFGVCEIGKKLPSDVHQEVYVRAKTLIRTSVSNIIEQTKKDNFINAIKRATRAGIH